MTARTPLAAFAVAAGLFLFVLALSALFVFQSYRDALRQGEDRAAVASQVIAVQFHWLIEASRQALRRIDDTLGYRPELMATATVGDLGAAIDGLPLEIEARLFDPSGRELLSTAPRGEINIADRPYFQELKNGAHQVVSPLLIDRVTRERSFVVGRRLTRAGEFAGIAAIVVPTRLMSDAWQGLGLGPSSAITVARSDGWIVARHPRAPEIASTDPQVLPAHVSDRISGVYLGISPLDGVERIVGFHRVDNTELIAFAGVAKTTALVEFNGRLARVSAAAIPAFLGLLGFAVWVSRLLIIDQKRRSELEQSLAENSALLREIHHRVKNNLQTVASLIRLQPLPDDAKRELSSRIAAMAMVHEQIYRSDRLGSVDLAAYLNELVVEVQNAFGTDVNFGFIEDEVKVDADRAMVVGLIVTEVVSNSLKYAFPDSKEGRIDLSIEPRDDEKVALIIQDNGIGFDPQSVRTGLGLKLIGRFVQQLGAEHTIEGNGGLHFVLVMPLEASDRPEVG